MKTSNRLLIFFYTVFLFGCAGLVEKVPKGSLAPRSLLAEGRYNFRLHKPEKVVEVLSRLIETKPSSEEIPEAYYLLGDAYKMLGQKNKAVSTYREIYKRFKNSPYAALAMRREGFILKEEGNFADAIERLKEAEQIYDVQFNFESCTYAIGSIYLNGLQDRKNAIVYFKRLLKKSPRNIHYKVKATDTLARIYYDEKDYKTSLLYYQDLVDHFGWSKEAKMAVDKLDELEDLASKQK